MNWYMNKETGELLSWEEMIEQGAEEYDLDDPTNGLSWEEYYEKI